MHVDICPNSGQYQITPKSEKASCPYCRGDIPDMLGRASKRMKLYMDRAFVSLRRSEEQKKYAKLALADIDSMLELEKDGGHTLLKGLYINARMMALAADMPEETIKVTGEVLSLHKRYPYALDIDRVSTTICWQAEAYSALGKWDDAAKIYLSLHEDFLLYGNRQDPYTIIGMTRTMYEAGIYDEAIKIGSLAFQMNRSFPSVHKYVALSQKAQGDIEEAKKTISRAILYEEHWDKDNLQKNKDILRELNNL